MAGSDGKSWPASLADYVGWVGVGGSEDVARAKFEVRPEHIAPNGFLQASVVVALADMSCARGTIDGLGEGESFTTVELKINLLGTATTGDEVRCQATRRHAGRTTQVWDAEVTSGRTGKTIALFRCTQLVLRARS